MDPLSITTGCLGLIGAVGKTTIAITDFVRGCREARSDLNAITVELSQLHLVLELLKEDTAVSDDRLLPESLQTQIISIITNCSNVIDSINDVLAKHDGKAGAARWVAFGKTEVTGLRMSLEAHRASLNLVLELVSVSLSKAIKEDTSVIRDDIHEIKQDTSQIPQIMEELTRLRAIVAGELIPPTAGGQNYVLEQYLDSLTSYAATVCNDVDWDSDRGSLAASRRPSFTDMAGKVGEADIPPNGSMLPDNSKSDVDIYVRSSQLVAPNTQKEPFLGAWKHDSVVDTLTTIKNTRSHSAKDLDPTIMGSPPTQFNEGTRSGWDQISSAPSSVDTEVLATERKQQDQSDLSSLPQSIGTQLAVSQAKFQRKVVLVGDPACGKTNLLTMFFRGYFLNSHPPTVSEYFVGDVVIDGEVVELSVCDTAGLEGYDRIRPLAYPNSHVIGICFSIDNPDSLDNIQEKWIHEVRHFCPQVPLLLVGLKKDLRNNPKVIEELEKINQNPVSLGEGIKVSEEIGSTDYLECSTKMNDGVKEVFEAAARLVLRENSGKNAEKNVKKKSKGFRQLFRSSLR